MGSSFPRAGASTAATPMASPTSVSQRSHSTLKTSPCTAADLSPWSISALGETVETAALGRWATGHPVRALRQCLASRTNADRVLLGSGRPRGSGRRRTRRGAQHRPHRAGSGCPPGCAAAGRRWACWGDCPPPGARICAGWLAGPPAGASGTRLPSTRKDRGAAATAVVVGASRAGWSRGRWRCGLWSRRRSQSGRSTGAGGRCLCRPFQRRHRRGPHCL